MKSSILAAACALAVFSCAPLDSKAPGVAVDIPPSQLVDYFMSCKSNGKFEHYTFSAQGEPILSSRGDESETISMVYEWKIVDGKTLLLTAKEGVAARVFGVRSMDGRRYPTQTGEIPYRKLDASMKTVRLQFSDISDHSAVTLDGRVFIKAKY